MGGGMIVTLDATRPSVPMRGQPRRDIPARSALAQAGCSESDIRAFLDDAASQ